MPEVSKIRTIAEVLRPESLASNRHKDGNEFNVTHPDFFSEGPTGDNFGKEPIRTPESLNEAYVMVGNSNDIQQRLSLLTRNTFKAGEREYDSVI
jgi:hypothetical protein